MKKKRRSFEGKVISDGADEELINRYGTYNIQPTADTDNEYPKIQQH